MILAVTSAGTCATCHSPYTPGDRVSFRTGAPIVHEACSEEGRARRMLLDASLATCNDQAWPAPHGRQYLPFQTAAIAYAHAAPEGVLFGDEMGLGKTIEAIGAVNADGNLRRILLVAPANLVPNWEIELRRWLVRPTQLRRQGQGNYDAPPSGEDEWILTSYESLPKILSTAPLGWDCLILDEAHLGKNDRRNPETKERTTRRAQALDEARAAAEQCWALTGTPIPNRVRELWPLLQRVAPKTWPERKFWHFAERYCDTKQVQHCWRKHDHHPKRCYHWEMGGAAHLEELQQRLRETCMVRRLKRDVLQDLPPKRRCVRVLPCSLMQACIIKEECLVPTFDSLESYVNWETQLSKVAFEDLSRVRQEVALTKVPAVIEHVAQTLSGFSEEESSCVVIWAHHEVVIDALARGLSDFGTITITGKMPAGQRVDAVERFQQGKGTWRVLVGSIQAAGVGLTMTRANWEVFVENTYRPDEMTQAEDRCHRIGQRGSVLVEHFVLEHSIDARMAQLLVEKQDVADRALNPQP